MCAKQDIARICEVLEGAAIPTDFVGVMPQRQSTKCLAHVGVCATFLKVQQSQGLRASHVHDCYSAGKETGGALKKSNSLKSNCACAHDLLNHNELIKNMIARRM